MPRKFVNNVPTDLASKMRQHMERCGYSQGTIHMRIGNLGYLFEVFQHEILDFLAAENPDPAVRHISDNLPPGGLHSADVQSFKLAWESIHGKEIFRKRVKPMKSTHTP